ncbi:hypothetical protein TNCV_4517681 [Trichonephila clavipes]|nr:hypothetical protein TNCV_4517681 [Trichonephila clavipes]
MRARAYCAHPSIRGHWTLRCMSRCPDQVVSLKRGPQCISSQASLVLIYLPTAIMHWDEKLSRPCPVREYNRTCGVKARYATT